MMNKEINKHNRQRKKLKEVGRQFRHSSKSKYILTFSTRCRISSMKIDIATSTKQTTATAHVGVSSRVRPPPPPAIATKKFVHWTSDPLRKNSARYLVFGTWPRIDKCFGFTLTKQRWKRLVVLPYLFHFISRHSSVIIYIEWELKEGINHYWLGISWGGLKICCMCHTFVCSLAAETKLGMMFEDK